MKHRVEFHIVSGIYPPDIGGPATFANSYSDWLAKSGHTVTVHSLTDKTSYRSTYNGVHLDLVSRKIKVPFRNVLSIWRLLQVPKGALVLVNGLFLEVYIASLIKPFKYIAKIPGDAIWERAKNRNATNHTIDSFQENVPLKFKFVHFIFKKCFKKASYVISPSNHLKNIVKAWGVSEENIFVVRNGVDANLFQPNSHEVKSFDLVTVCRLVTWKGLVELIDVASELKLSLLIVGSGPDENNLRNLALKSDKEVVFIKNATQVELPSLLNKARAFVLNSEYEGNPHALLEAMSCGMVVIARENPGNRELVEHAKTGILVNSKNSLFDAISYVFSNPTELVSLMRNARNQVVVHNNKEEIFRQTTRIMEKCS